MVYGETFLRNFKFYAKTLTKVHDLTVHLHYFSMIKSHNTSTKQWKSRFFLQFLLDNRRIRIRISDKRIRIQEAQKHTYHPDLDPQPGKCYSEATGSIYLEWVGNWMNGAGWGGEGGEAAFSYFFRLMIEGSGSVSLITDLDQEVPKTYGSSGSGSLTGQMWERSYWFDIFRMSLELDEWSRMKRRGGWSWFFLLFPLDDRRIWIHIREAQKYTDHPDPDPQHWLGQLLQ